MKRIDPHQQNYTGTYTGTVGYHRVPLRTDRTLGRDGTVSRAGPYRPTFLISDRR